MNDIIVTQKKSAVLESIDGRDIGMELMSRGMPISSRRHQLRYGTLIVSDAGDNIIFKWTKYKGNACDSTTR